MALGVFHQNEGPEEDRTDEYQTEAAVAKVRICTPMEASEASAAARANRVLPEDEEAIDGFEASVTAALLDHFDGLSMGINCEAPVKVVIEISKRFGRKGWTVGFHATAPQARDAQTGVPIVGSDPCWKITLTPNWHLLPA